MNQRCTEAPRSLRKEIQKFSKRKPGKLRCTTLGRKTARVEHIGCASFLSCYPILFEFADAKHCAGEKCTYGKRDSDPEDGSFSQ